MRTLRYVAALLSALVFMSIAGCGRTVSSDSPRRDGSVPMRTEEPRRGMSNQRKVLLLAGAAALYYLYNKHKNAQGHGPEGQYYRSRNGRIYYRDRQGNPVWVTAPQQPIEVPADEYARYTGRRYDDYQGRVIREAPAGW